MADWLELELAEELHPVAAPDELWERVRGAASAAEFAGAACGRGRLPHRPEARRKPAAAMAPAVWASWPIAAIVTLMIAAATLWLVAKGQEPGLDLRQLAIQELRAPRAMDLRSSDPAQINDWIGREAGVEVGISERTGVRLTGARVIREVGARIAVVTYQVGDDTATLLVARAGSSGDFGHGQLQWQARGQNYALATSHASRAEAACLLCHAAL